MEIRKKRIYLSLDLHLKIEKNNSSISYNIIINVYICNLIEITNINIIYICYKSYL